MHFAVVIPTYNRSASLRRTLSSILTAAVPPGMKITVTVVANRCTDDTTNMVGELSQRTDGLIRCVVEDEHQGRSFALNTGIRNTESELIGFVDDDEEIDGRWFEVAFDAFRDSKVDYIGGRYEPRWECDPPTWVNHPHIRTAIGWADFGDSPRPYADKTFDALLMGGNCVLRRACFAKVGLYSDLLGRKGSRLLAGEDSDMHDRLIAAGLKGIYLPDLIVYHHIPARRVTRQYMRSWAFWSSASTGYVMRASPPAGPRWWGLPRYLFTNTVRALVKWLIGLFRKHDPAETFHHELRIWRLGGALYGRHCLSDPRTD